MQHALLINIIYLNLTFECKQSVNNLSTLVFKHNLCTLDKFYSKIN